MKVMKVHNKEIIPLRPRNDLKYINAFAYQNLAGRSSVNIVEFDTPLLIPYSEGHYIVSGNDIFKVNDNGFAVNEIFIKESMDRKDLINVKTIDKNAVVLGFMFRIHNNIGHFMIDQLPFALYKNKLLDAGYDHILIFGVSSSLLRQRLEEFFDILKINSEFTWEFRNFTPVKLNKAIFVQGLSRHPVWKHPVIREFYSSLRPKISDSVRRRLFVSRSDAKDRLLVNEKELFERLESLGFELIIGSQTNVKDSIEKFSNAEIVVGVSGAPMVNIVYCLSGTPVINILGEDNPGYWYYDLANLMNLDYYDYRCKVIENNNDIKNKGARVTTNFTIDVNDFYQRMKNLLS